MCSVDAFLFTASRLTADPDAAPPRAWRPAGSPDGGDGPQQQPHEPPPPPPMCARVPPATLRRLTAALIASGGGGSGGGTSGGAGAEAAAAVSEAEVEYAIAHGRFADRCVRIGTWGRRTLGSCQLCLPVGSGWGWVRVVVWRVRLVAGM